AGLAPSKRDELALEILDASAKRDDLRVSLSDGLGGFLLTDPCALERSFELVRSDAEEVVLGAKRQKIVLERARSLLEARTVRDDLVSLDLELADRLLRGALLSRESISLAADL